ncbi:MAG: ATP synthase F1 subunit gamma [Candidatus Pacebacteria bacterium]|jgi:F-type H+-transporting ATPase subunit gamma|nr:ATP synthase F1 subunit gamma [Candidatus Paceibacterota bacterium]NMB47638.1 ATP synthase F1 subunit gamma [Patescibacteria group bacterium]MDD2796347.1 ATP synthase F1 subunit gamma [Candidatus Paceibacterota bacterium]MDD3048029.1 ATP synthase F1 subunit gamma [Candidatus Paceibacterota bacterium]MDD3509872.1 ATP synthase F1 subunit gamma [Candidatus Paceibacterota bacterium]
MDLRAVKVKIGSVKNITEITAALETFSALKMRKTQKRFNETKEFRITMARILKRLDKSLKENESVFLEKRKVEKILVCVVASDRGFCGPFNLNVLRFASNKVEEIRNEHKNASVEILPIGKKAISYYKKNKENVKREYFGIGDFFEYGQVKEIADFLVASFLDKDFDKIYFIYNGFISSFLQKAKCVELFPLNKSIIENFIEEEIEDEEVEYILEPTSRRILDEAVSKFILYLIYQFVLSANTAEHSARMMAMKSASDNASSILDELRLEYNKARQQNITNEVIEISSTKEAMG